MLRLNFLIFFGILILFVSCSKEQLSVSTIKEKSPRVTSRGGL